MDEKLKFLARNNGKKIKAFRNSGPELERLTLKAIDKIREFLIRKVETLKIPNTNIAFIQQTVLLKYKELFWFLLDKFPEIGLEIHATYVDVA